MESKSFFSVAHLSIQVTFRVTAVLGSGEIVWAPFFLEGGSWR